MKNFLSWFRKDTNYPLPVLTLTQRKVLDELDTHLTNHSNAFDGALSLHAVQVPLRHQFLIDKLIADIKNTLPIGNYIPRSIALVVGADGDWNFIIGYRGEASDPIAVLLFQHALNETNSGRAKEIIE